MTNNQKEPENPTLGGEFSSELEFIPEENNFNAQEIAKESSDRESLSAEALARLAKAEAQAKAYYEDFLRAKAENENNRRRAHEEIAKTHKFAIEAFAEQLLPVIDSLEAALSDQSDEITHLRKGVDLVLKQLHSAIEKNKVHSINPAAGEKFDPHRHQAIAMLPSDQEINTVISVLRKGYLIADRVLRPALVNVSAGPSKE